MELQPIKEIDTVHDVIDKVNEIVRFLNALEVKIDFAQVDKKLVLGITGEDDASVNRFREWFPKDFVI